MPPARDGGRRPREPSLEKLPTAICGQRILHVSSWCRSTPSRGSLKFEKYCPPRTPNDFRALGVPRLEALLGQGILHAPFRPGSLKPLWAPMSPRGFLDLVPLDTRKRVTQCKKRSSAMDPK